MAQDACLFCRIAAGDIPAERVHEDAEVIAFRDVSPQAPVHVLLIPRRHVESVAALTEADAAVLGRLFVVARAIAESSGIADSGYRLVTNSGADAGQSVQHLHVHLLGGRRLAWPPG